MIRINLLPEEAREKKEKRRFEFNPYMGIGLGLAILLLVYLGFSFPERRKKSEALKWQKEWEQLEDRYEEARSMIESEESLEGRLARLKERQEGRILWARKLNEISDVVPDEIQLTGVEISGKGKSRALNIAGIVYSPTGERSVGDFIKAMKDNESFAEDFSRIRPGPITEVSAGRKQFFISCYFK